MQQNRDLLHETTLLTYGNTNTNFKFKMHFFKETYKFLPFFSESWRLPELLADLEPLELQSNACGIGGQSSLRYAQLFLQDCFGGLMPLCWVTALLLPLTSKHHCTNFILQEVMKFKHLLMKQILDSWDRIVIKDWSL